MNDKKEKSDFLKKFEEIQNRERGISYFADDDYDAHLIFIKKIRQDLCRLISGISGADRDEVLEYIKEILENCDKERLLIWYNSDFSTYEVREHAQLILVKRFGKNFSE